MTLVGRGATGAVYQITASIAVKRARTGEDEQTDHAHEQKIFRILENHSPIPYLIRCHYQRPQDTFLEFAANGCMATLLNRSQERDGVRVLGVSQLLDSQDVLRWMRQLCLAAAGLEEIGLAHGDIRPGNMLLDADWNLKLCDLDRAMDVGEDIMVLTEPFGRLLNQEEDGRGGGGEGGVAGTYGKAGARTETFAIGSVYYTLLRGHEPFETEDWGKGHFVVLTEKFQKKDYPPLMDSAEDVIIRKCWEGEYRRVRDLVAEFSGDEDAKEDEQDGWIVEDHRQQLQQQQWLKAQRMDCIAYIENGSVDMLNRF